MIKQEETPFTQNFDFNIETKKENLHPNNKFFETEEYDVKIEGPKKTITKKFNKKVRTKGQNRLTKNGIDLNTFIKTKICPFLLSGHCSKADRCTYAHSQAELRDPPNLKKTKMCQLFLLNRCNMGLRCSYAHGENELRSVDNYKSSLCSAFERGECNLGEECRFAHSESQIYDM